MHRKDFPINQMLEETRQAGRKRWMFQKTSLVRFPVHWLLRFKAIVDCPFFKE